MATLRTRLGWQEPIDLFGYMAGTAKICGDIISPIEDAGWTGNCENI
jgi:hypothetical protein